MQKEAKRAEEARRNAEELASKTEMADRFRETLLQRVHFSGWRSLAKLAADKKKLRALKRERELARVKVDAFWQDLNSAKKLFHRDLQQGAKQKNKSGVVGKVSNVWKRGGNPSVLTPIMPRRKNKTQLPESKAIEVRVNESYTASLFD